MSYSKYRAKPVVIHGIRFASTKEGRRYQELKLLEKAGEIKWLKLQRPYAVYAADIDSKEHKKLFTYYADFVYEDKGGIRHVEDVKGVRTPVYRLKKRIIEAVYGIKIEEI